MLGASFDLKPLGQTHPSYNTEITPNAPYHLHINLNTITAIFVHLLQNGKASVILFLFQPGSF